MNIIVARKLHERRFRPNPVMTTGELLNLIGSDGMQEALERRWLVPDQDTGFLMLNFNGGKLVELESACLCKCGKTDCACGNVGEAGQTSTMPAAMREQYAAEDFAGYGVTRPTTPTSQHGSTQPAPMMRVPDPTPTEQVPQPPMNYRTGDPAEVMQDNITYQGEIAAFEPDGRVRLRWKGQRPPNDRPYGPGEFIIKKENPDENV
jgi:hypothetical protein